MTLAVDRLVNFSPDPFAESFIHPASPACSAFSVSSEATTELEEMIVSFLDGSTLIGVVFESDVVVFSYQKV